MSHSFNQPDFTINSASAGQRLIRRRLIKTRIFWWLLAAIFATPVFAGPPSSFEGAKKLLSQIHEDIGHLETLYCGCSYIRNGKSGNVINSSSCGYKSHSGKKQSSKIQWEHVVPASWFGDDRPCWKEGHDECIRKSGKKKGERFAGRECCKKSGVDPKFMTMFADPHNLFPAIGELNRARNNYPYGEVKGEPRKYGTCDFEVLYETAEPAECVRGELARAMLYMHDEYGVKIRGITLKELVAWHVADPPQDWERRRAQSIEADTGLRNDFILSP